VCGAHDKQVLLQVHGNCPAQRTDRRRKQGWFYSAVGDWIWATRRTTGSFPILSPSAAYRA